MTELNPSQVGIVTELALMTQFAANGCTVFTPFGSNTKVDLIIEYKNQLYKIQCKHATKYYKQDVLDYIVFKTHWQKRDGTKVAYTEEEVDFFATIVDGKGYLIPISETCSTEKRIRFLPPGNGQKKGITFAQDYTIEEVLKRL